MDEAFAQLRSGAANIAGVDFQVAMASYLLSTSRLPEGDFPVRIDQIRPEGFEDIDCRLSDGSWLLVQCKQRGVGNSLSRGDVLSAVAHALQIEATRDYDGNVSAIAIVSNVDFAAAVPTSGWASTVAEHLGVDQLGTLEQDLGAAIAAAGLQSELAVGVFTRLHTVVASSPLQMMTENALSGGFGLSPTLASILRAQLYVDLADLSARQRGSVVAEALARSGNELDSMVELLVSSVDVDGLDRAVAEGVCEFANFLSASPDSAEQFYRGVSVIPAHIAADLDVIRVEECESILTAIAETGQVLIVGPSGTGKSALLWRSAKMLSEGARVIRVLDLSTKAHATELARYVQVLRPSHLQKVIVCVDNLGRSDTEFWTSARDLLAEIPGVILIGACRQEDLLPSISTGAALVDSSLQLSAAHEIYDRLVSVGIELQTEPEEAIDRSNGLLMEFIALATSGQRIRDVLAVQIQNLRASADDIAVDCLSLVTAAHTLGTAVEADALPDALHESARDISRALVRLQDEHLVVSNQTGAWRGLHDLRAELILEILHSTPPPTLASTYAKCIRALPEPVRPVLFRRAAIRVARRGGSTTGSLTSRLRQLEAQLRPLADSLHSEIVRVSSETLSNGAAAYLSALIESSERLDVVAYVAATITHAEQTAPPSMSVNDFYTMIYSARFSQIFRGNPAFAHIEAASATLPDWSGASSARLSGSLNQDFLVQALKDIELHEAVRFSESLESFASIPLEAAESIYRSQMRRVANPPSVFEAGLIAQLTASLTRLAALNRLDTSTAFGATLDRAVSATMADTFSFSVSVEVRDNSQLPESSSALTREETYGTTEFMEVSARLFARSQESDFPVHAYAPQPGQDPKSINAQAVFLAERLFDACPEADVVQVEVVHANLSRSVNGVATDGFKRIRSGVLARRVDIRRSVAVQAAALELASSERWTARCREQAKVAADLVSLLKDAPQRLGSHDNARRRQDWRDKVELAAARVSRMPGIPMDRSLVEAADEGPVAVDFVDLRYRDASKDHARDALDLISNALLQASQSLTSISAVGGAGLRLSGAPQKLDDARRLSPMPTFAGVGETLPLELDELSRVVGRVFAATGRGAVGALSSQPSITFDQARIFVEGLARATVERSGAALVTRLGIEPEVIEISEMASPPDPLNYFRLVAGVNVNDWPTVERRVRDWSTSDRANAGFDASAHLVALINSSVVRVGLGILGSSATPIPLLAEQLGEDAVVLGRPMSPSAFQQVADERLRGLIEKSYEAVRVHHRPPHWRPTDPSLPEPDSPQISSSDPPSWTEAVAILERLRTEVLGPSTAEELAREAASVDITRTTSTAPSPLMELVGMARALAIAADLEASDLT